ncbi:MAG TPA: prepilin-type N-terminal cleavage/methylation domain-containing protein [Bryobacteraceae bacterium]|jgi:prepilin-type N-terminal cleavage/methylation domain-containing protein|nr:prepilin-type N-terminal cleavage/methylation domain-containing protein [Bryobacteraceae bacterium]
MKRKLRSREAGFTLLEVMVATLIMGIAVVGLLSNLHVSLRNTARLTDYDRATLFAQHKMDDLLASSLLPNYQQITGGYDPGSGSAEDGGWRALARPFEYPPNPQVGDKVLQRVELEIWWNNGDRRRSFTLEGFRQAILSQADAARLTTGAAF